MSEVLRSILYIDIYREIIGGCTGVNSSIWDSSQRTHAGSKRTATTLWSWFPIAWSFHFTAFGSFLLMMCFERPDADDPSPNLVALDESPPSKSLVRRTLSSPLFFAGTLLLLSIASFCVGLGVLLNAMNDGSSVSDGSVTGGSPEVLQQWMAMYDSTYVALHRANNVSLTPLRSSTPQWDALQWLHKIDTATADVARLQQRYILAVLYFHFLGPERWELQPEHGWFDFAGNADGDGKVKLVTATPSRVAGQPDTVEETIHKVPLNECEWLGVHCDDFWHVEQLDFANTARFLLSGSIPTELGWLPALKHLAVPNQQLKGAIPRMMQLTHLDVSSNQLSFPDANDIGQELRYLDFSSNSLSGNLSSAVRSWTGLQVFKISVNTQLAGNIWQDVIPFWQQLEVLEVYATSLSGVLPTDLSQRQWKVIRAGQTPVSGYLPSSWAYQAPHLEVISINTLTRNLVPQRFPLEWAFFSNLTLLELHASGGIEGSIPPQIARLSKLEGLNLGTSKLTGTLPTELGLLTSLKVLKLAQTSLTGTIPSELSNISSLNYLEFQDTDLTGSVPLGLCGNRYISADCAEAAPGEPPEIFCECCTICLSD